MSDRPTIGRVVHYLSHGSPVLPDGTQAYRSRCRAAVVTDLGKDGISLAVLNPTGMFFDESVPADSFRSRGGTWHWPEREDAP